MRRVFSFGIIATFVLAVLPISPGYGFLPKEAEFLDLPAPGSMVALSPAYTPVLIKGMKIHPENPLLFDFIIEPGNTPFAMNNPELKKEINRTVKYFLAGLTIPDGDLWVNLSPYEKKRVIADKLGQTQLGRDMLAQDYILKQFTASLVWPEGALGKKFWNRIYMQSLHLFGTTQVPINTFNKVWIVPKESEIFEDGHSVYVTKATLKIMLEEDFLALYKHQGHATHSFSSQIVRQLVLPAIEEEVNKDKNFAPLRQIYQSLILAKWYKETIQKSLLNNVYVNKTKIGGINISPTLKGLIYNRYLEAYKKGVFNYVKEERTPNGPETRKYFSGGEVWDIHLKRSRIPFTPNSQDFAATVLLQQISGEKPDHATISNPAESQTNPLPPLKDLRDDPDLQEVFRGFVRARYQFIQYYAHLSGYMQDLVNQKGIPDKVRYYDQVEGKEISLTPEQYADRMVDFMIQHADDDPSTLPELFGKEFPNWARPEPMTEFFQKYWDIKPRHFDYRVVDLLRYVPKNEKLTVVDVGGGTEARLAEEIKRLYPHFDVWSTDLRKPTEAVRHVNIVHQDSGKFLPFEPNSVDVVVLKWVLHHVQPEDLDGLLKSVSEILKPGGILFLFEAQMDDSKDDKDFNRTLKDEKWWPQSQQWQKLSRAREELTRKFRKLSLEQQKKANALEDYFGHTLVMGRSDMPQPQNYQPIGQWVKKLKEFCLTEVLREVIGFPPVLVSGPPSMLLILEKETPHSRGRSMPRSDGGYNPMLGVGQGRRIILQSLVHELLGSEYTRGQLEELSDINDIVVPATSDFKIYHKALELLNAKIGNRIVLVEQKINTLHLIEKAVNAGDSGYKISIPFFGKDDPITKINWEERKKLILSSSQRMEEITGSASDIIRQIMDQMIQQYSDEFPRLYADTMPKVKNDNDFPTMPDRPPFPIITIKSPPSKRPLSWNANPFDEYRKRLQRDGSLKRERKIVLLAGSGMKALLEQSFQKEIDGNMLELYTHLPSLENLAEGNTPQEKRNSEAEILITMAWENLIYSKYGLGMVQDKPGSLGIDQYSWKALIKLFDQLPVDFKHRLGAELFADAQYLKQFDPESLLDKGKNLPPNIKIFVQKLQRAEITFHKSDSSMASNGGIDLNNIALKHSGISTSLSFATQMAALNQNSFEGFMPVIVKITPLK